MLYPTTLMAITLPWATALVTQVGVMVGGPEEQVGVMVSQVVEHHLPGCHLVIISTTRHSQVTSSILRHLNAGGEAVVVVEAGSVFYQDQLAWDHHLLQGLWGDARTTCRVLFLDLTSTNKNNTHNILWLAEEARLWKLPETVVIAIGGRAGVRAVLLHHSLRNTVHALYLALHHNSLNTPSPELHSHLGKIHMQEACGERVLMYRRRLFCKNGEADITLVLNWSRVSVAHNTDIFQEHIESMMGHKVRIVAVPYFPYMDYETTTKKPGDVIIPRDSVDARLINTFAHAINFTFEIKEEPEKAFGLQKMDGAFTGMMGQLQREEVDFCTIAGPSPERLRVIEFLRGYPSDLMTLTSLKPTLLPQHLSLIRPFRGELWVVLLVSVVAWGVTLWLLQKAWQWVAGGRRVDLTTALLYGWGALLQNLPSEPSVSNSGRMLVGWWLVFCLVITTGYSSALIAHMTVQGKTRPIETLEDLVNQKSWKWATEPWLLKGVPFDYFSKHVDPVVKKVFKNLEVEEADGVLRKVQAGSYTLIDFENYVTIIVASRYMDNRGNTPFFISKRGFSIMAAFGWGFRKGAPFYPRFLQLLSRLEDAGIISYWIKDVIARRVRDNRAAAALDSPALVRDSTLDDQSHIALGMHHMQGAFYLLFLGFALAFLTLLGENLTHCCSSPQ